MVWKRSLKRIKLLLFEKSPMGKVYGGEDAVNVVLHHLLKVLVQLGAVDEKVLSRVSLRCGPSI